MDISNFKASVGSLVIDGALVLALIVSVVKLTSSVENIDRRVVYLETANEQRFAGYQRLSVVETALASTIREQADIKNDIAKRLDRIEEKQDRIEAKLDKLR